MERYCSGNSQYSRRECLETSDIPDKTHQIDLEDTTLNIFRKLDAGIHSLNIEDCHWFPSKGPKRDIIKLSKQKCVNRICHFKKNMKGMDLTLLGISSLVFINDIRCQYYKFHWRKCRKLLTNKFIDSFWLKDRP